MTPLTWAYIGVAIGIWIVVAVALAFGIGRYITHNDDDYVNWLAIRPPVPPLAPHLAATQADIDATWLDAWPTSDDDDQIRLRFEQIVEAERSQGWAA